MIAHALLSYHYWVVMRWRFLSTVALPIPLTLARSSAVVNGAIICRYKIICWAFLAPIPSSCVSCASLAVLILITLGELARRFAEGFVVPPLVPVKFVTAKKACSGVKVGVHTCACAGTAHILRTKMARTKMAKIEPTNNRKIIALTVKSLLTQYTLPRLLEQSILGNKKAKLSTNLAKKLFYQKNVHGM